MIPTEIWQLDYLRILSFSWNNVTGTISTQIGSFRKLERFEAAETGLDGTIPTEIGLIFQLERIDLTSCGGMSGPLPSELGNLADLKELWLRKSFSSADL